VGGWGLVSVFRDRRGGALNKAYVLIIWPEQAGGMGELLGLSLAMGIKKFGVELYHPLLRSLLKNSANREQLPVNTTFSSCKKESS